MTLSIVDEEDVAKEIYRGSINGRSILSLPLNVVQATQFSKDTVDLYRTSNEVWTRSLERRQDGSVAVLLNRNLVFADCPSCFFIEFQDVTDQYSAYL